VPFDGKNPSAVMHKHLKADLVPPDHVNPKLSAGISEVIEMMMAKDPKKRYANCKDLLVDLRAVRKGEQPPIAHQEIVPAAALQNLAAAEAAAPVEIPEDRSNQGSRPLVREPLVITLAVVAVASIVANIVLLASRGG
jgi:serine/threonine-protein kinase